MNIEEKYDWNLVRLVDLCEVNPRLIHNKFTDDLEVSFLPMKYVDELSGIINLIEVKKLNEVNKGYTYFENGDIIFAKITPCMENGKIAIVNHLKNGVGFGSTEFHVLRCSEKISHKYLFYFLIQSSYRKIAQRNMTGTAGQLRVPKSFIENSEIPLPPLPKQKKIVAKIEELFSELDKGIEQLKKAKEQLRVYRQSVLSYAFSGRLLQHYAEPIMQDEVLKAAEPELKYCLNKDSSESRINTIKKEETSVNTLNPVNLGSDDLPEGWKWVKLGEITENYDGRRVPLSKNSRAMKKGNYRYYGATGVIDHVDSFLFEGEYLLIGEDGANLLSKSRSLAFIVDGKFWVNNHAHVLKNKPETSIKFLSYYINSLNLDKYVTGSAQPKLTQANLNRIPVPYPRLKEQTQIVEEIESRFSVTDNMEQTIDENLKKAEALRQSILKKAFEGRLHQ